LLAKQKTDKQIVATPQREFEVIKYCESDESRGCYFWWAHTHTHTHTHTPAHARAHAHEHLRMHARTHARIRCAKSDSLPSRGVHRVMSLSVVCQRQFPQIPS